MTFSRACVYTDVEGKITEGSTDPVICEQLAPAPAIIDRREPETGDDITGESRQSSDEEDISLMELLGGLGSAASVATKWSMSGLSNVRSAVKTTVSRSGGVSFICFVSFNYYKNHLYKISLFS